MATRTRTTPYQRPRRQEGSGPLTKLVISGLHYEINEADLVKIFKPYGTFSRDPSIRYDRSGRSTGFAYVNYENEVDADVAKTELDGVLAKGQEIRVRLERASAPREAANDSAAPRGGAGGKSLLNRLGKTNLMNRLSDAAPAAEASKQDTPRGPGAVRNQRTKNERNKPERTKTAKAPRPKPKTAEDLDKELEAYVEDGGDKEPAASGEDVSMAA